MLVVNALVYSRLDYSNVVQGRSQDFTLGVTKAESRRRENRGAESAEEGGIGERRAGVPSSTDWGFGERRELPQRGPGRSPGCQRIFGTCEANRTLLVERTVLLRPNKASFFS